MNMQARLICKVGKLTGLVSLSLAFDTHREIHGRLESP